MQRTKKTKLEDNWDDNISISSEDENTIELEESNNDVDIEESVENKRKRLAMQYLTKIKQISNEEDHEENSDQYDRISSHLAKNRLVDDGKYFREIAESYKSLEIETTVSFSGPKKAITSVALSAKSDLIFAGSKDNSIFCWDTEYGKKNCVKKSWSREDDFSTFQGEILSLSLSYDGKFLVSGGRDGKIRVFDCRTRIGQINLFSGHRDAVTSMVFKNNSSTLFTGSLDRSVKSWNLDEMNYTDTFFGHQAGVTSIDCGMNDFPVTSSVDRTLRLWNAKEGSHLVYRGCKTIIDCVQSITGDLFISGGQDGSISLWKSSIRKPLVTVTGCHDYENQNLNTFNSVTSLCSLKGSDLCVSGSKNGLIKFWKVDSIRRELLLVKNISVKGFVNDLKLSDNLIVAALGREPKLGRWDCLQGNLNKIKLFKFKEVT